MHVQLSSPPLPACTQGLPQRWLASLNNQMFMRIEHESRSTQPPCSPFGRKDRMWLIAERLETTGINRHQLLITADNRCPHLVALKPAICRHAVTNSQRGWAGEEHRVTGRSRRKFLGQHTTLTALARRALKVPLHFNTETPRPNTTSDEQTTTQALTVFLSRSSKL